MSSVASGRSFVDPTGFITFKLFGPDDPTCSDAPIFTTSTRVAGNGYYALSSYVTNAAGTYRWISSYSGDNANRATAPTPCGMASATAMVAKRHVALTGDASEVSPTGVITKHRHPGQGRRSHRAHRHHHVDAVRPRQHDLQRGSALPPR